jgi:hypothetical protein
MLEDHKPGRLWGGNHTAGIDKNQAPIKDSEGEKYRQFPFWHPGADFVFYFREHETRFLLSRLSSQVAFSVNRRDR